MLLQTVLQPVSPVSCFWSFMLFLPWWKLIPNSQRLIIWNTLWAVQGLQVNQKKGQKVGWERGQETKMIRCPMVTWIQWQEADYVLQIMVTSALPNAPNSSFCSLKGQACPKGAPTQSRDQVLCPSQVSCEPSAWSVGQSRGCSGCVCTSKMKTVSVRAWTVSHSHLYYKLRTPSLIRFWPGPTCTLPGSISPWLADG